MPFNPCADRTPINSQFHPDDDNALSVLTYAVEDVNVHPIVLVGHTKCGGVAAAAELAKEPAPPAPPASPLPRWLGPLTDLVRAQPPCTSVAELEEENVRAGVRALAASAVVKCAWADVDDARNSLQVHGWLYELETGRLRNLCVSVGKDGPLP